LRRTGNCTAISCGGTGSLYQAQKYCRAMNESGQDPNWVLGLPENARLVACRIYRCRKALRPFAGYMIMATQCNRRAIEMRRGWVMTLGARSRVTSGADGILFVVGATLRGKKLSGFPPE